MKKLGVLLICGLLLAGCSSPKFTSQVTDGSKTIVSNEKIKITKQEYYEYLLETYGSDQVLDEALKYISEKEVTDQKEIDKLVKERSKTYAQYSECGLGEYAKSMGYKDEKEYQEQVIVPSVKQELLRKKYINEHYEDLMKEFNVCAFKKIVVEKESTALTVIKNSKNATEFDKLMKTYGEKAEDCGIVTKNSTSLDENLVKKISDFSKVTKDGVYKDAVKLSDDTYAVIFIYNTNHKKNKANYQDSLSNDEDITETIQSYYLKKYEFTINEENIKNGIKEISDKYVNN